MAYSMPAPYAAAVRSGLRYFYTVDATVGGVPVAGATGMRPIGGTITDTTKAGVRRTLNLELAPTAGLFDALKVYGTTLTVTATVVYANQSTAQMPMGVFDVDQVSMSDGGGKITVTAPDKWQRLVRANFTQPLASQTGVLVAQQIAVLIQNALGSGEQVIVSATSKATMPALVWDPAQTSRAQAIIDLAGQIGAYVYADRYGTFRVDDVPTSQSTADWLLDASASGVLLSLDRTRDRTHTYNVVTVESSASGGALFNPVRVWDTDPNSPTFAGTTDPFANPSGAGPFGIVSYHFATPLTMDANGAKSAGLAVLAQTIGIASSAQMGVLPNPAMDSWDSLDVLPLGTAKPVITGHTAASGSDPGGAPLVTIAYSGAVLSRHIADTVTHQLDVSQPQTVQGRSTRTDPYS